MYRFRGCVRLLFAAVFLVLAAGCSGPLVTNTPRSAVEQQLISTVIERGIRRASFIDYAGKRILPEYSNLAPQVDLPYVKGVFETHMARYGITIAADAADADYIIEVLCGVLATDQNKILLGTPPLPIPVPETSISIVVPEIALFSKFSRKGFARFTFNILRAADRKPVGAIEGINASAYFNNWVIILVPFTSHDLPLAEPETTQGYLRFDF